MPDSDTPEKRPENGAAPDTRAARVRHRLIGALCILAVAVLLWELGDDVRPPDLSPDAQTNTDFPDDDFVQVRIQPPQSQIQNNPAPHTDTNPVAASDPDDNANTNDNAVSVAVVSDSDSEADTETETEAQNADSESPEPQTQNNSEPQTLVFAPAPESSADADADAEIETEMETGTAAEAEAEADFIQVGAFGKPDGAEQLARWLRGDGFHAVVKNENGIHRVFSDANPEHLAALGYIQDDSPANSEAKPDAAAESEPSPFVVQLGAFSSEERAREMVRDLRKKEFAARIEPVRRGGEQLFRVRVVGLPDRDAANAIRNRLSELGYPDAQAIDNR